MKIKAAVLYEPNTPMVVETIDLDEPQEGEVLVRIVAAGVCYSDYHIMKGEWSHPKYFTSCIQVSQRNRQN